MLTTLCIRHEVLTFRQNIRLSMPSLCGRSVGSRGCAMLKSLLALLALSAYPPPAQVTEIHCKHFFYGYPTGTPASNDLIIRDLYALSSNDTTKFSDWLAYRLSPITVADRTDPTRTWRADPFLDEHETLEPPDYTGANKALDTDRGHQGSPGLLQGLVDFRQTNYLSNITHSKHDLNNGLGGIWKRPCEIWSKTQADLFG